MKTKKQHPHWPRIAIAAALVLVTLSCSTTSTSIPPVVPTRAPTQTPIPTWTPVPTPKPTTGEISGRVIDSANTAPVPNANVTTDPPTVSVTADAHGRYIILEVPPGVYTVTAAKAGYASTSVQIAVAAGKTTTTDVHLTSIPTNTPIATLQNSSSAETKIDFDGLPSETLIDDHFLEAGVSFENTLALAHRYAVSPPNAIASADGDRPIVIRFPTGATRVGIQIDADGFNADRQPHIRAFDAVGTLLGIENFDQGPAYAEVEFPGQSIFEIQLGATLSSQPESFVASDAYDNLVFEMAQSPLADGLVAYYPFNGNADDESSYKNHGTVYGASLAADRSGSPNSAYEFDGVDDYIEIADSDSLDIEEQVTIAAWVMFYSNPGGGSRIVEKPYAHCGYPWVMYALRMCCRANRFAFDVTSSGSNHVLDSAHGQSAEEWHHIVGTYDGETQRIYIDGVLDGLSGHTGMLNTNDQPVAIGGSSMCLGHPRFEQQFHGLIDDVRIYNRALDEVEVQALYEQGE